MITNWQEVLTDIFAASINQQTLDEGAEGMVLVSQTDPELHESCLASIDSGIAAGKDGDASLVSIINRSGYRVSTPAEGVELLTRLRRIYLDKYIEALDDGGQKTPGTK
ncbi:MAG: hypothetical protein NTW19_01160 [Planctomycetota bacterium]|nr:hypothetical protein [Planctomycetota bacterium]